ncbi:MAG: ATP-binding protein, partial [Cryomorphaceae bacterium]
MAKLKNPFLLTGFHSVKYFCDREREFETLKDHLANDRNIVLYSWRRIGKTSLLKYLLNTLEKEKKAETLYVDLLSTNSTVDALELITQAVYDKFGKTKSGLSAAFQRLVGSIGMSLSFDPHTGIPAFSFSAGSSPKPETSFRVLGEFLKTRKQTVIVAIDEFQRISNYQNQNGEAVFRSWMQSFPELRFIYSGSHRHMMTSMFAEKNRPFYRSTQLLDLEPIEYSEYEKFIRYHFSENGKEITKAQIREIYVWSRGQTYCIQLICNKLFGSYDKVSNEDLAETYREIIAQEAPLLANYADLLTQMQWQVLCAIAKNEPVKNPHSRSFIESNKLGAVSSVSTALTMLVNKEIVIKDGDFYLVHEVIFTR